MEDKHIYESVKESQPLKVDIKSLKKVSPLYKESLKQKKIKGKKSIDSSTSFANASSSQTSKPPPTKLVYSNKYHPH